MKRKGGEEEKVSTLIVVDSENVYAFMLCFTQINFVDVSENKKSRKSR
jgi:hypothetical protein